MTEAEIARQTEAAFRQVQSEPLIAMETLFSLLSAARATSRDATRQVLKALCSAACWARLSTTERSLARVSWPELRVLVDELLILDGGDGALSLAMMVCTRMGDRASASSYADALGFDRASLATTPQLDEAMRKRAAGQDLTPGEEDALAEYAQDVNKRAEAHFRERSRRK